MARPGQPPFPTVEYPARQVRREIQITGAKGVGASTYQEPLRATSARSDQIETLFLVIAGLVPAIPIAMARPCLKNRETSQAMTNSEACAKMSESGSRAE